MQATLSYFAHLLIRPFSIRLTKYLQIVWSNIANDCIVWPKLPISRAGNGPHWTFTALLKLLTYPERCTRNAALSPYLTDYLE